MLFFADLPKVNGYVEMNQPICSSIRGLTGDQIFRIRTPMICQVLLASGYHCFMALPTAVSRSYGSRNCETIVSAVGV